MLWCFDREVCHLSTLPSLWGWHDRQPELRVLARPRSREASRFEVSEQAAICKYRTEWRRSSRQPFQFCVRVPPALVFPSVYASSLSCSAALRMPRFRVHVFRLFYIFSLVPACLSQRKPRILLAYVPRSETSQLTYSPPLFPPVNMSLPGFLLPGMVHPTRGTGTRI